MADSVDNQTLIATFAFGMVVSVASLAVLMQFTDRAKLLYRGGIRLVLVAFLLFSIAWAGTSFGATFVDTDAGAGCQIAIAFASAFDQLARITLEEFLFWAMKTDGRLSLGVLFPQGVIFLRFVLGGVFVGVQRPQFKPVCTTTTLFWPLGIAVLVADAFIVLMLFTRASSAGILSDMQSTNRSGKPAKGIVFTTIALGLWISLSVPMILGVPTFDIAVRTAVPAGGLLVVIACLVLYNVGIEVSTPNDKSVQRRSYPNTFPGLSDMEPSPIRSRESRNIPTMGRSYPTNRRTSTAQQPSRDVSATMERANSSRDGTGALPLISGPSPGQAIAGVGGLPVKGELFPPMRSQSQRRRDVQAQPAKKATIKGGKMVISYPKVNEDIDDRHPLKRIPTIDLQTAALMDRDRRINTMSETGPVTALNAIFQQSDPRELQSASLKRKQVARADSKSSKLAPEQLLDTIPERSSKGASSASEPASGIEDVRRRSPRHISQEFQPRSPPIPTRNEARSVKSSLTSPEYLAAAVPLQPPPRSPLRPQVTEFLRAAPEKQGEDAVQPPHGASELAAESTVGHPERKDSLPPNNRKSTTGKKASVEVLVPPVPPLSPRDPNIQTPYSLNEKIMGPSVVPASISSIPRSRSVKTTIRPSRQRPISPSSKEDTKPVKPPVQRRPTTGLPNNPRAQTSATSTGATGEGHGRTAMFVNETDSGDSESLRDIMNDMLNKQPPHRTQEDLQDGASVVNRPRPIPRKSLSELSTTRKTLPSLPTPDPSSPRAALKAARSALNPSIDNPNEQPPLPAMASVVNSVPPLPLTEEPRSDGDITEPTSQSTSRKANPVELDGTPVSTPSKQAPPTSNSLSYRQQSETELKQEKTTLSPSEGLGIQSKQSKNWSKFSVASTVSPYEASPSSILQSPAVALLRSSQEGLRRKSSPVLPLNDSRESATPASLRMHSERPLGSGSRGLLSATSLRSSYGFDTIDSAAMKPGFLGRPERNTELSVVGSVADRDDGRETVMVMLDPSIDHTTARPVELSALPIDRNSSPDSPKRSSSFHRRVGDQCPTFSDRLSVKSRRVPQPTPLQLHKVTKRSQIPSTPESLALETPQQALDKIHEQLKQFDQPTGTSSVSDRQRMTLLNDLEQEMDMQESRWQQMREDMPRDSVSTAVSSIAGSPAFNVEPSPMNSSPPRSKLGTSNLAAPERDNGRPRSSVLYTADQVQISRVNIQPEKTMLDFDDGQGEVEVPLVFVQPHQPGPAPILIKDDEIRMQEFDFGQQVSHQQSSEVLSEDAPPPPKSLSPFSPQPRNDSMSDGDRPVSRKSLDYLPRDKSSPSSKSPQSLPSSSKSTSLLWIGANSPKVRLSSLQSQRRPHTLKPPRRSRRASTLPDILESPEPMQNKRGTLGIFQFPWGERSDNASLPTALQTQMFMNMSFQMMTGVQPNYLALQGQTQQLHSHQQKSSSVFEDEDDVQDSVAVGQSSESGEDFDDDDSFDETTLWEIASLLKSDRVPSRDSLLPDYEEISAAQLSAIADDELASMPSPIGLVADEPELDSVVETKRESSSPTPSSQASLWAHSVSPKIADFGHGLLQPDVDTWQSYALQAGSLNTRSAPRAIVPATISSSVMWSLESSSKQVSHGTAYSQPGPAPTHLWSGYPSTEPSVPDSASGAGPSTASEAAEPIYSSSQPTLWSIPVAVQPKYLGIQQPEQEMWARYTNVGPGSRPKARKQPALTVKSTALWSLNTVQSYRKYLLESPAMSSARASPTTIARISLAHSVEDSVRGVDDVQADSALRSSAGAEIEGLYASIATNEAQDSIVAPSTVGSDLWVPIAVLPVDEEDEGGGLFGTVTRRHTVRGTPKSPAAKKTRPTPRAISRPLSELQSSSLWRGPSQRPVSHDWAMLSSIQTRPLTHLSVDSDTDESSADDCSSVQSGIVGGSALGSVTAEPDNLMPIFVSTADWMNTLSTTLPAQRPMEEIEGSVPNWAAALHRSRAPSIASSTFYDDQDSDEEEEEDGDAVFNDRRPITQFGGFDPARHHPVFDVDILNSSGGECHPAATGYIYAMINHNPDLIQR